MLIDTYMNAAMLQLLPLDTHLCRPFHCHTDFLCGWYTSTILLEPLSEITLDSEPSTAILRKSGFADVMHVRRFSAGPAALSAPHDMDSRSSFCITCRTVVAPDITRLK
jgi:hypothetical protein